LSVQQPDELQAARSLALRPSSISPRAISPITDRQYKDEPLDELRRSLSEKLNLKLQESRLFRSVEVSKDGASASSGLTLDVEITYIWRGSKSVVVPIVARSDPSVLEVSGTITTGDTARRDPVLEFICRASTGGAIVKSKKWMHENIDKVSGGLSKLLLRINRLKKMTRAALTATSINSSNPLERLLAFPPDTWARMERGLERGIAQAGLKPQLFSFRGAVSQPDAAGTVIAVIVTKENAERLLLTYSRMLGINKRTVFPYLENTYLAPEKLDQIFRETEHSKERMVWIWYAKKGTTHWNKVEINASTSLLDLSSHSELKPTRTLIPASYLSINEVECRSPEGCASLDSAWVYNSAIFIFPQSGELSPRPESSESGFELHTQFDRHPVLVRF